MPDAIAVVASPVRLAPVGTGSIIVAGVELRCVGRGRAGVAPRDDRTIG